MDDKNLGDRDYDFNDDHNSQEMPLVPWEQGGAQQPTVPPNLPFGSIGRPDNSVTPSDSVIQDTRNDNQNDPNKSDNNQNYGIAKEGKENSDSRTPEPPTKTGLTDQPSFHFPSRNDETGPHNTVGNNKAMDENRNVDQTDNVIPTPPNERPIKEEYQPANDIVDQIREEMTTTTTTTRSTPIRAVDNNSMDNINDEPGKTHENKRPNTVHYPPIDSGRSGDFPDYSNDGDATPKPLPKNEDSINMDKSSLRSNDNSQINDRPHETNNTATIPHGDHSGKSETPPQNQPRYPEVHTINDEINNPYPYPVDKETSTHFTIEDYEDDYEGIEHIGISDNIETQVFIGKEDKESDKNTNVISDYSDQDTVKDFRDVTKIHRAHNVENEVHSNKHPVDVNVPGVTGGNFTFNYTNTSHNTTGNHEIEFPFPY